MVKVTKMDSWNRNDRLSNTWDNTMRQLLQSLAASGRCRCVKELIKKKESMLTLITLPKFQ